ncbi:hypothetical protein H3C66_05570 [Patescibacteria group bacterium]|nr:hypothetical protein [Patescibacteria group bacterium]
MQKVILLLLVTVLVSGVFVFLWIRTFRMPQPAPVETPTTFTVRYVALGDSYTAAEGIDPAQGWPQQLSEALNEHGIPTELVATVAQSGWTTTDLIRNGKSSLATIVNSEANFVTLMIGANDGVQGASPARFHDNLEILLDQLLSVVGKEQVILVTIPDFFATPVGASYASSPQAQQRLADFNKIIKTVGENRGVLVVDVYELSQEMRKDATLVADDGLHPSATEYGKWVKLMLPEVKKLLQPDTTNE